MSFKKKVVQLPHNNWNFTTCLVLFYGTFCSKIIFTTWTGGKIRKKIIRNFFFFLLNYKKIIPMLVLTIL